MSSGHIELASHLLRRSLVQEPAPVLPHPGHAGPTPDEGRNVLHWLRIDSPWALLAIALTFLLFFIVLISLQYTLWNVVGTLTIIETPQTVLEGHGEAREDAGEERDIEVANAKQVAITSSIRGTLRHLTARAGWTSRWRGLSVFLAFGLVSSIIMSLFRLMFGGGNTAALDIGIIGETIGAFVAFFALARWNIAWVHVVISEPSSKRWWSRLPGWKAVRVVALPMLVQMLASRANAIVVVAAFYGIVTKNGSGGLGELAAQLTAVFVIVVASSVLVALPAYVALVRVQASLLPEEDESIVPFDRSFGGKVKPAIVGGTGALSLRDAFTSIDRASMNRIIKVFVKVVAIEATVYVAFLAIFFVELLLFRSTE